MSIPDFQTVMRPLLERYTDGTPRRIADVEDELAGHFMLTPDERAEMLPSGKQQKFKNRVRWAATHLKNAGAIDRTERGVYRITDRGTGLLDANSASISVATLNQFEEFRTFHAGSGDGSDQPGIAAGEPASTPEESIARAHEALRHALVADLQERMAAMTPAAWTGAISRS